MHCICRVGGLAIGGCDGVATLRRAAGAAAAGHSRSKLNE
jgi:hypothetical protein